MNKSLSSPRGLLPSDEQVPPFVHQRIAASEALSNFVEHFWFVEWAFADQKSYEQKNLPHPTVHFVIDPQLGSALQGPVSQAFTYSMKGSGKVLGIKLKPAAISAFLDVSADKLRDCRSSLDGVLDCNLPQMEFALLADGPNSIMAKLEAALLISNPVWQERASLASSFVKKIESTDTIFSVETFCEDAGLSVRSLQRLFSKYIGVSPKWVIERYRMIEAVEQMRGGEIESLTELAQKLGYFDQAHFSKAFTNLLGYSPSKLLKRFSCQQ